MSVPHALAAGPAALVLWGGLLGIGTAWGLTQFFMKIAMTSGLHPVGAALWQAVAGALVATAVLLATGRRLPLSWRHCAFFAACGLLGTALPASLSFTAIQHLPVGIQALTLSTVPLMTLALALPIGLDRPEPRRLAGLGLGALGVALIVGPEASLPEPGQAAWVVLPMIVALSYASENIVIARFRPEDADAFVTGCGLLWAATVMLAPIVALGGLDATPDDLGAPFAALVAAVLLNIVAYVGFVWLNGEGGAVFASQVGYVVTATGVVSGLVFLGERHAWTVWLAMALLFAGIALVRPRRRAR
ncbi:MAG: DMT family transporter [Paracoccaceae bacterium]